MSQNNPYLIQRCKTKNPYPKRDGIKGIDSILSMDYMGSAEFEFGSLPQSLKRLTPQIAEVKIFETKLKSTDGRGLFLVCTERNQDEAIRQVTMAADEKLRTKEYVGLERALKCEYFEYATKDLVVWWDIDHDWFACLGKPVAQDVLLALQKLAERWQKEGKI